MRFKKFTLVLGCFTLLAAYSIHQANGNSGGVVGRSRSGCGGGGCHTSSSGTTVTISTQATQIVAGQTYTFQLVVKNASKAGGGCNISVDNSAKLATSGGGLLLYSNELTHTQPRSFTGDSATWTFKYTAPTTLGTAHIYAAGNAVNLNGDNSGDAYATATYTLTVVSASGPAISIPATFRDTVLTGTTMTSTLWVKNAGTTALTINRYALKSGASFHFADTTTHSIAAKDSAAVKIQFAPLAKGTIKDTVQFYSNDASTPTASTILTGVATAGTFQLAANPVQCGTVVVGQNINVNVPFKNSGNGVLLLTPKTLTSPNPDFTLLGVNPPGVPPLTVAPGATVTAAFRFAPTQVGGDTTSFTVTLEDYPGMDHDTTIRIVGVGAPAGAVASISAPVQELQVYPNPSSGLVNITSGISGDAEVDVSDEAGKIVFSEHTKLTNDFMLNLNSLPSGAYFLRVRAMNGEAIVRRIVIASR